ncbi:MAG: hypothetical protein RMJ67_01075 [Elusimicrobiota bacterium]|nr:hypothetical protein [Endomicrobiia bacterium]MDW8165095.1 hypothetical protein [Elusimicrobiota bacterium]
MFGADERNFLILKLTKYKRVDRFSILQKNKNIKIPLYLKEIIPYISELRGEQCIDIRYYAKFRTYNFTIRRLLRKSFSIRMKFYGPYGTDYSYKLSRYISINITLAPLLLYARRRYETRGYISAYSELDTFLEKKKYPFHIF